MHHSKTVDLRIARLAEQYIPEQKSITRATGFKQPHTSCKMSDSSPLKPSAPSRLVSNEDHTQPVNMANPTSPGPSIVLKCQEGDGNQNKDNVSALQPKTNPSTNTSTAEVPTNAPTTSDSNPNESPKDKELNKAETMSEPQHPSTYEINGITYQYGVGYANQPLPETYQRQRSKLGTHPNMMSYVDGAGVKHEIHIPTGTYHRAAQSFRDENWDELGKFPAYAGQKYTEADYFIMDESNDEGGEKPDEEPQKCPCGGQW
ncbi:hypothetical protein V8F20_010718 [Naviculisporaceae sp. PSN 640]